MVLHVSCFIKEDRKIVSLKIMIFVFRSCATVQMILHHAALIASKLMLHYHHYEYRVTGKWVCVCTSVICNPGYHRAEELVG